MDVPSRACAPFLVMICSLRASCCIPNLLSLPGRCAQGSRRVGLGTQDAISGMREGSSGVLKGTRQCGPAPLALHLVPLGPGAQCWELFYYVMKQLFPLDAATRSRMGHINGSGSMFGLHSDSCVSISATGSALYGGCAMLTAGLGQCVVEAAGSFGAGASAEGAHGHGVSNLLESSCGPWGGRGTWRLSGGTWPHSILLGDGSVGNLVFAGLS